VRAVLWIRRARNRDDLDYRAFRYDMS